MNTGLIQQLRRKHGLCSCSVREGEKPFRFYNHYRDGKLAGIRCGKCSGIFSEEQATAFAEEFALILKKNNKKFYSGRFRRAFWETMDRIYKKLISFFHYFYGRNRS